jgi:single-stranded-DNA-specific exonuclease
MTRWQIPPSVDVPPDLLAFTGDTLLAQLLVQRGCLNAAQARAFLEPDAYRPAPPTDLPNIDIAVTRLTQAIDRQEFICVWGDFDVDGQTSTTVLVSTLQSLGARVCYYIPNRLTESHGIKVPALQKQLERGIDLLLTCDTGIAEHEAVAAAQAVGVTVIITDHHDLPDSLPPAHATINPKRLPADHPLRELPGVGVAYLLALALLQAHGRPTEAESLLDLVALGIVADVARQTNDTRYWLQRGLDALNNSARPGVQAILENIGIKTSRLTEEHIGFWLAPRLNALGRLGDANLAVELLSTDSLSRARIIAMQLEGLNDQRKMLVDRVLAQALSLIEENPALAEANAIVLAANDWHPGVLGLAAGRLTTRFGKPVILLTHRPDGPSRGSARSVPGCDIHQAIKTQTHLLTTFGGHPMAAGLSLPSANVIAFRQGLSAALADCMANAQETVRVDVELELSQISLTLLTTVQRLAPFGAGNPAVQFGCRAVQVVRETVFGKTGLHRRVTVQVESGDWLELIWWGGAAFSVPKGQFNLAFTIGPDNYRGGVQAVWLAADEWDPPPEIRVAEFQDFRQVENPRAAVSALPETVVWADGQVPPGISALRRDQLGPAETLVIWTAPPSDEIFRQTLRIVNPLLVVLVGWPSPLDSLTAFKTQLMGLTKNVLTQKSGEVDLPRFAGALGHRLTTAELGLAWMAAQGRLTIQRESDDLWLIESAQQTPSEEADAVEKRLKSALAETAAYRRFFRRGDLSTLKQILNDSD